MHHTGDLHIVKNEIHHTLDLPTPYTPTDLPVIYTLSHIHTSKQVFPTACAWQTCLDHLKHSGEELLLEEMSEILHQIWEWRRSMNVYNCCWSMKVYNCCHFPCMSISRACSLAAFDTEEGRHAGGSRSLWTWHLAVERGWWELDRLFSRTQRYHREKLQEKVGWLMCHYKGWEEVRNGSRC